jgi:hypothetical protein
MKKIVALFAIVAMVSLSSCVKKTSSETNSDLTDSTEVCCDSVKVDSAAVTVDSVKAETPAVEVK